MTWLTAVKAEVILEPSLPLFRGEASMTQLHGFWLVGGRTGRISGLRNRMVNQRSPVGSDDRSGRALKCPSRWVTKSIIVCRVWGFS